jgi:hypothetical protein
MEQEIMELATRLKSHIGVIRKIINGNPERGTCVLIEIDNHKLMIASTHVVDHGRAYLLLNDDPVEIITSRLISISNNADAGNDELDIAYYIFNEDEINIIEVCYSFLPERFIGTNVNVWTGNVMLLSGFPVENPRNNFVLQFVLSSIQNANSPTIGYRESNLDIRFNSDSFHPHGMSGGPVWQILYDENLRIITQYHLIGIIHTLFVESGVINCTRIDVVTEMLHYRNVIRNFQRSTIFPLS